VLSTTYIALGSNLGNKQQNIEQAIELLKNHGTVAKCSSFYTTEPVGYLNQEDFLNVAIEFKTTLTPHILLKVTQNIEQKLGRVKTIKNGPRIIDLDILFYENKIINKANLIIPHPRMHERSFVLDPLCEIAPNIIHPKINKSVKEIKKQLS